MMHQGVKMMDKVKSKQTVLLEHVYSMEYYQKDDHEPKQILKDISLTMHKGEIWEILGTSAFELRLLLEIIANSRAYQKGTCVLAHKGMMRKKRGILPHVYYIGSTNMLFDNMNVLEYLMFITAKDKGDVVERQKRIFQDLLDMELGYLSLSTIRSLTPAQRSVVTLMAALMSESELIVWNIARLQYDELCKKALTCICEEIKKQEKTLVFSTFDYAMCECISTHIAGVKNGTICYKGSTSSFMETWDHASVIIEDDEPTMIKEALMLVYPDITCEIKDQVMILSDEQHREKFYQHVFDTLAIHEIYPRSIVKHKICVENAWKEVCVHDL